MSRTDLTTALRDAYAADSVKPYTLVEMETNSGYIRVWDGLGDLVHETNTYTGIGTLLGISTISESSIVEAVGATITLSGIPSASLSAALSSFRANLPAKVWIGAFNLSTGAQIADPYLVFQGFTDEVSLDEGGDTSTIQINLENRLVVLEIPLDRRFTDEDQKIDYPSDVGFEYVPSLQDAEISWGPK